MARSSALATVTIYRISPCLGRPTTRSRCPAAGSGRPVPRQEDARLLLGRGRFLADLRFPGALHAAFVRSPHAHAHVQGVDARRGDPRCQASAPSSVAPTSTTSRWSTCWPIEGLRKTPQPALAGERARFAGEAVAIVLARQPLRGGGRRRGRRGGLRAPAARRRCRRCDGAGRALALPRARIEHRVRRPPHDRRRRGRLRARRRTSAVSSSAGIATLRPRSSRGDVPPSGNRRRNR